VLLQAVPPQSGQLSGGNGVQIGSLLRFSDSYKSQQMWRATRTWASARRCSPT
jgi:flagellar hook-associated protein 1 FlgK